MEDSLELDFDQNKYLAQSVSFGPNIKPNLLNSEVPDVPDYIDDFLQISPDAVFIDGNKKVPKKKKIKKIIKKKIKKKIDKNYNSVDNTISNLKKEELIGTKHKTEQKEKTGKNIVGERVIQSYINKAKIPKDDFSSKNLNENGNKNKDIKKDAKEEDKKENINKVEEDKGKDKDKNDSNKVEESKTKIEEKENKTEDIKEKLNEENPKEEIKKEQEIKEVKKEEEKKEEEEKEEDKKEDNKKEETKKEEVSKESDKKDKKEEEEKTEIKEIEKDDKNEENKEENSNGQNINENNEIKKEDNEIEKKEEKKVTKEKEKSKKKEDKVEKEEEEDEEKDEQKEQKEKESENAILEEKIKSVEIKDKKEEDNDKISDTIEKSAIFDKFNSLVSSKVIFNLSNVLKIIYFFKKVKECQNKSSTKISSIFRGYLIRKNFKLNYLTLKILNFRDKCCSKIIAHFKGYLIRKISKPILQKKEDNYLIYSTLSDNKMLYFKSKFLGGLGDNIYFEYCKLLNCFVHLISRKERNLSKKKVEGFFYNEKYKKLTDSMYEKNQKGENIIDIPQILKKNNENIDKYDKVINEYIKSHRPVVRKRENLLEYEERKKKALDDDTIMRHKNFEKVNKMSRSKSFMRLKGVSKSKGILKPSKSYINLRSEEKKIQFGKARIKGYHLAKK
jgi:hypothetical protein